MKSSGASSSPFRAAGHPESPLLAASAKIVSGVMAAFVFAFVAIVIGMTFAASSLPSRPMASGEITGIYPFCYIHGNMADYENENELVPPKIFDHKRGRLVRGVIEAVEIASKN